VRILLVRLRLIGDVVFTSPLVGALRRRYPDAHLTYLVEPAAAPAVLTNPDLDDVRVVPRRRGWARVKDDWRLARQLRQARFDVAFDLHGGPRGAFLTWASRAPVRVGYDVAGRAWLYTHRAYRAPGLHPRHSVENQWDLLTAFDAAFAGAADRTRDRTAMPVDPAARAGVQQKLATWRVGPGERIIVLHVSAGNPFRRWPEEAFAALAARLARGGVDRRVLVTSGPSDHAAAARVVAAGRQMAGEAGPRIVDAEGLSLPELRALTDGAALFVGGDSGPLHVASTSDVPIVGLYGPTLPERSAPWRPPGLGTVSIDAGPLPCRPCHQRRCVPGDFRCLTHITAETVGDAAEHLLGVRPGSDRGQTPDAEEPA
jgi:lipopolysaccharide heptosyltransferase II